MDLPGNVWSTGVAFPQFEASTRQTITQRCGERVFERYRIARHHDEKGFGAYVGAFVYDPHSGATVLERWVSKCFLNREDREAWIRLTTGHDESGLPA